MNILADGHHIAGRVIRNFKLPTIGAEPSFLACADTARSPRMKAFGGSASRYTDGRNLALADTIAVENVLIRTDFLAEKDRAETRQLLLEYQRIRVHAIATGDLEKIEQMLSRAVEIHGELWDIAVRVRTENDSSVINQWMGGRPSR